MRHNDKAVGVKWGNPLAGIVVFEAKVKKFCFVKYLYMNRESGDFIISVDLVMIICSAYYFNKSLNDHTIPILL